MVYAGRGRFGPYVQLGERGKKKPKYASLPPDISPYTVTLDEAVALLRLPRKLGEHPENGRPVLVGCGVKGPYVQIGERGGKTRPRYIRLPKPLSVFTLTLEEALKVQPARRASQRAIKEFEDGAIRILDGRYGPYVTDGSRNASVPASTGSRRPVAGGNVANFSRMRARKDHGEGQPGADSPIRKGVHVLRGGGVIAYPNESVYGLGCLPRDEKAVERVLRLKGRDRSLGLILVAGEWEQFESWVADLSTAADSAGLRESEGITWVMRASPNTPAWITGGRDNRSRAREPAPPGRRIEPDAGLSRGIHQLQSARHAARPHRAGGPALFRGRGSTGSCPASAAHLKDRPKSADAATGSGVAPGIMA